MSKILILFKHPQDLEKQLLTQRYLVLLAQACHYPEEVIALTFTRKAAAEMRERVLSALHIADCEQAPEEPHRLETWRLAKQVLIKDHTAHWQILLNPQRLRILTLDALAAQITSRLPVLSGLGNPAYLVEQAIPFYRQTVQYVLTHLEPEYPWTPTIIRLLEHLDNQAWQLEELFIDMLAKREQWLPYITPYYHHPEALRQHLEKGLLHLVEETLQSAYNLFPQSIITELLPLARSAGQYS